MRTHENESGRVAPDGRSYEIVELELDDPGPGEVQLRFEAAGVCHSDLHILDGDLDARLPR